MPGMAVGYARSSTVEQDAGFEAQQRDLKAAGCERIFAEKVSSVAARPQLEAALAFLREGDTLTVCKPDRLARSIPDLTRILADLKSRGIGLRILSMGLNTLEVENPTTALMLTVLGAVAQFERALMLERQREGVAAAKAAGRYKGRPASINVDEVRALAAAIGPAKAARKLRIARSSVYRLLEGDRPAKSAASIGTPLSPHQRVVHQTS